MRVLHQAGPPPAEQLCPPPGPAGDRGANRRSGGRAPRGAGPARGPRSRLPASRDGHETPRRHGSLARRRRPCHPLLSVRGLSSAAATAPRGRREGASARTPDSSASRRPQLTCPEPLQLLHRGPEGQRCRPPPGAPGHVFPAEGTGGAGCRANCAQRSGERLGGFIGARNEPDQDSRDKGGAHGGSRCSSPRHAGLALHLPVAAPEGARCRGGIRHGVDVTTVPWEAKACARRGCGDRDAGDTRAQRHEPLSSRPTQIRYRPALQPS